MNWNSREAGKETRRPESDIGYPFPFENKWDVLRRDDLPDGEKTEIDYRLQPEELPDSRRYCVFLLVFGAVFTLAVIFLSHLLGNLLAEEITFVLSICLGVGFVLKQLLDKQDWLTVLLSGVFWPGLWLVMTVPAFLSQNTLLIIGAALSVFLADAIATHYLMWLNADPNLSKQARITIRDKWRLRFRTLPPAISIALLIVYVSLLLFVGGQVITGVSDVVVITVLFALGGTASVVLRTGSFKPIYLFWDALVSWVAYGRFGTDTPGVFQSPRGGWGVRVGITACALVFVASAILPFASYFPVVFIDGDKGPWVRVYAKSANQSFSSTSLLMAWNDYKTPELREIIRKRLTNAEVLHLRRLKSNGEQKLYILKKQLVYYLESSPGAWLSLVVDGLFMGEAQFFWAALVSFLGCLFFPLFVLLTILFIVSGEILYRFSLKVEEEKRAVRNDWEGYVERLQTSPNLFAREHLWLGNHATEDYPVLLHQDVLREHAHILGDSGSGKSALAVAPLFTQLIRKNDSTVVIIDLKGDMPLFEGARKEAGARFKYFTNEIGKSTYLFNPFSQLETDNISVNQFCEVFLSAMGLEHGEGYGRSYFSRVARRSLTQIINAYPGIQSFQDLKEKSADFPFDSSSEKNDAYELIAVIESLASFEQINFLDESRQGVYENAIYWPDAISENQVVYFWLPAAVEVASVREIAKLALYTLFTCAYDFQRQKGESGRIWLCIDEFQHIASLNFKLILQQARSMGLGVVLANQSSADLDVPGSNIRSTVQSNTRFKQYFSVSDRREMAQLVDASGETLYSDIEEKGPRLSKNDLIRISDSADESIAIVGRGKGYSQYGGFAFALRSLYHIDESEYLRRGRASWPPGNDKTIVAVRKHTEMPPDISAVSFRESNILVDFEASLEPTQSPSDWGDYLKNLYIQQIEEK